MDECLNIFNMDVKEDFKVREINDLIREISTLLGKIYTYVYMINNVVYINTLVANNENHQYHIYLKKIN